MARDTKNIRLWAPPTGATKKERGKRGENTASVMGGGGTTPVVIKWEKGVG